MDMDVFLILKIKFNYSYISFNDSHSFTISKDDIYIYIYCGLKVTWTKYIVVKSWFNILNRLRKELIFKWEFFLIIYTAWLYKIHGVLTCKIVNVNWIYKINACFGCTQLELHKFGTLFFSYLTSWFSQFYSSPSSFSLYFNLILVLIDPLKLD
jgi:hypothetical protein